MQIVDHPAFAPGLCLVSKKGGNRPMIDLGRDFDFDHEGRMYVSIESVKDLGHAVGMLTAEEQGDLENRLRNALTEVESLHLEIERLTGALDAVKIVRVAKKKVSA